jgi:hypothetical protein
VFFGSGINNFGVQEILQALVDWAPPPQPRDGTLRVVQPTEPAFTGFVFKIQANMDPHRDRIAFFRVCSGRYVAGHEGAPPAHWPEMKIGNALTFMANERVASEDAVAGDIIGIHNHGQLQIGDTLTEGEALASRAFRTSRRSCSASRGRAIRSSPSSCKRACRSWARRAPSRCSRPRLATCCSARSGCCSSRSSRSACRPSTRSTPSTTRPTSTPRAG